MLSLKAEEEARSKVFDGPYAGFPSAVGLTHTRGKVFWNKSGEWMELNWNTYM